MIKVSIDKVIEICLTAIYKNQLLKAHLYLKGGQYLRVKENLKNRFSVDTDFSYEGKIEDSDAYFETLKSCLETEFHGNGFYMFAFKAVRRPKMLAEDTPDFWIGWAVEFKFIEASKRNLEMDQLNREAIVAEGAISPKVLIDISQSEYIGSSDVVKIKSVNIKTYSRELVILEKLRALCQQHPDYPYKDGNARGRDYFDIEQLWSKAITEADFDEETFKADLLKHIQKVFAAKDVDLGLLKKIQEHDFVESQRLNWSSVEQTVAKDVLKPFDYYMENLKEIVKFLGY